jgi:ribose transport system substrate-binding protein
MKNTFRIAALFALSVLILTVPATRSVAGGGAEEQADTKRVAVVTPYMASATTAFVIERFQEHAREMGWRVTVSDTAGDFGLLVSRIQDAVAQNVDAIVLGMGDPVQMTAGLSAAERAGIPVFGLDAGVTDGVLVNVTSDNTDLGTRAAQALIEAMGDSGRVLMFTHDPHPGVRERARGAQEYLESFPGITIVDRIHIDVPGPVDNARRVTEDFLTANPRAGSLDGIWAGWDEPAYGAVQAIGRYNRNEIAVVGIDGTDFAKNEIDAGGPFVATIEQDFDGMARELVRIMDAYFQGTSPEDQWVMIPGTTYK